MSEVAADRRPLCQACQPLGRGAVGRGAVAGVDAMYDQSGRVAVLPLGHVMNVCSPVLSSVAHLLPHSAHPRHTLQVFINERKYTNSVPLHCIIERRSDVK